MIGSTLGLGLITALLFSVSTYLLLSRKLINTLMGIAVLTHATNVLILAMSGAPEDKQAPVITDAVVAYVDPLPQALILTAIVIGFGVSAFFTVYVYRLYKTESSLIVPSDIS